MGGKTGSAEYDSPEGRKKHTWMIAFAPFDRPRYAVALVVEDGVSGGVTAAPRVGYIMARIFGVGGVALAHEEQGGAFEVSD
jgi:cell division protein FtsI/penicillin-binding protein 2